MLICQSAYPATLARLRYQPRVPKMAMRILGLGWEVGMQQEGMGPGISGRLGGMTYGQDFVFKEMWLSGRELPLSPTYPTLCPAPSRARAPHPHLLQSLLPRFHSRLGRLDPCIYIALPALSLLFALLASGLLKFTNSRMKDKVWHLAGA